MKLSVIIVNYNVEAYLEQCLRSVLKAMERVDGDVFVVDNQSTDDSVAMVQRDFPSVKLIANSVNVGFSRANNQAIERSSAEYVVLLNPDTVVGEDVFERVIEFMDRNQDAGGLGVKMIDGTGRFLPESKRGLPTPAVAFYKIIGLTRLFPRSSVFGKYHLGHLPEDETAEIEILSGACMFLRKSTLDKVGLLDESFFMYGEDIDLSYRILLGGWKNYYFPEVQIIHYKGESTKKSSINYVRVFYNAMAIFAKKHFATKGADFIGSLINVAIFLSAVMAIVARFLLKMALPILDVALTGIAVYFFRGEAQLNTLVPLLTFMLAVAGMSGVYDMPVRLLNIPKGIAIGAVVAATANLIFGLFDWYVLSLSIIILTCATLSARTIMHFSGSRGFDLRPERKRRVLTIGSQSEAAKATALLWQTHYGLGYMEHLNTSGTELDGKDLRGAIHRGRFDEVIFCASDIPAKHIINLLNATQESGIQFKIAAPDNKHIIGPNSIESLKDLFLLKENGIISSASKRSKRLLDIGLCVLLFISLPISIWFIRKRKNLLSNMLKVLKGDLTWVGFSEEIAGSSIALRKGIIPPTDIGSMFHGSDDLRRVRLVYAKDYHYTRDIRAFFGEFHQLGR